MTADIAAKLLRLSKEPGVALVMAELVPLMQEYGARLKAAEARNAQLEAQLEKLTSRPSRQVRKSARTLDDPHDTSVVQ